MFSANQVHHGQAGVNGMDWQAMPAQGAIPAQGAVRHEGGGHGMFFGSTRIVMILVMVCEMLN